MGVLFLKLCYSFNQFATGLWNRTCDCQNTLFLFAVFRFCPSLIWLQPELDSNESLLQCQLLSVILITAINPALIQNWTILTAMFRQVVGRHHDMIHRLFASHMDYKKFTPEHINHKYWHCFGNGFELLLRKSFHFYKCKLHGHWQQVSHRTLCKF